MDKTAIINQKILLITNTISEQFPELTDFLNEMPVSIPNVNHPTINQDILNAYYQSLIALLENYKLQITLKQQQHD